MVIIFVDIKAALNAVDQATFVRAMRVRRVRKGLIKSNAKVLRRQREG